MGGAVASLACAVEACDAVVTHVKGDSIVCSREVGRVRSRVVQNKWWQGAENRACAQHLRGRGGIDFSSWW